jgi:uridylate kinase
MNQSSLEIERKRNLNETRAVFVIKLSGSTFSSSKFNEIALVLRKALAEEEHLFLILIAGGGAIARKYIEAGLKLGLDQATLDEIGISCSRLNATLLTEALRSPSKIQIPRFLSEIEEQFEMLGDGSRVLVCGGLHPGQSTNAVGALIAEATKADCFVNATDVDGIYDKDPRQNAGAVLLENVTPSRLSKILEDESVSAGTYDLMDPVALKLIMRSRIPTKIVKCESSVLSRVLHGEKVGSAIIFQK